jgi:anthranilate phosphoribosyltransferase
MSERHPFAVFIRTIGTGPGRARPLTADEARRAAAMMLDGSAEEAQCAALLMLLRYRKETPEELAGFVRAVRDGIALPDPAPAVDLDWPSYAFSRNRGAPLFLLSALLLAGAGVKVLMHGLDAAAPYAGPTASALAELGIPAASRPEEAARQLVASGFAFLPLSAFQPGLQRLLNLRTLMGLRSPANTVARLMNPFAAAATVGGVFHPAYRDLQQRTAGLLGDARIGVFKGGGGEAERNPAKECELFVVDGGDAVTEIWPALLGGPARRAMDAPAPPSLAALWRGDWTDDCAVATVTGTAAIALRLAGRADGAEAADRVAHDLWEARDRARLPASSGLPPHPACA